MTIWIYSFEDGTVLKLIDIGFSTGELWELKKIHGICTVSHERI